MTPQQKEAPQKLWERNNDGRTLEEFVASAVPEMARYGAFLVRWCGMIVGIEKDGYTHT